MEAFRAEVSGLSLQLPKVGGSPWRILFDADLDEMEMKSMKGHKAMALL